MMDDDVDRSDALQVAAKRRIELKHALSQVEIAAAGPAGEPGWRDELVSRLEDLQVALLQHVEDVEAEDGLLAELERMAPRLVNHIAQVRDEHPVLCRQVATTIAGAMSHAEAHDVRAEVLATLSAIASHRQKGADLVYEGYSVDIGGS